MKPLADTIRKLFSVLLVLHVTVTFALPAGTHLNICIGSDGNIDVSIEACFQTSTPISEPNEAFCGQGHHGDCTNVESGCAPSDEVRLATAGVGYSRSRQEKCDLVRATGEESRYVAFSTDTYSTPISSHLLDESISSSHLVFLRTSVLLI